MAMRMKHMTLELLLHAAFVADEFSSDILSQLVIMFRLCICDHEHSVPARGHPSRRESKTGGQHAVYYNSLELGAVLL